jgi:hypothetical protein
MPGCAGIWGFEDAALGADGGSADASADEGRADEAGQVDAAPETLFHQLDDPTRWAIFDVATADPGAVGYRGGAFDGRFFYLVPYRSGFSHGAVARYDTHASFTDASAWSTFDVASVHEAAKGFVGAAFDGRFLYFVPFHNGALHGRAARYDTHASFNDPAGWRTFDTTTVEPSAKGFIGAVFDGRHVTFVPQGDLGPYHGVAARYDTRATFDELGGWTTLDLNGLGPGLEGFYGGVMAGGHVFLPASFQGGAARGSIARYEVGAPFTSSASWTVFEAASLNDGNGPKSLAASAFDGQRLYFVSRGPKSSVLQSAPSTFTAATTWKTFELPSPPPTVRGAVFDGRHVYVVPYASPYTFHETVPVTRHDTWGAFEDPARWTTLDLAGAGMVDHKQGFWGGVFDGRYVYLVPANHSKVLRFEARSTPGPLGPVSSFL